MSKPVLGRGLDRLMAAPPSGTESINLQGNPPPVAPGLRILIRGADELRPQPPAPAEAPQPQPQRALAVALIAADLALLAWPAAWIFTHAQVTWVALLATIAAVSLAALCGVFAIKSWRGS